MRVRRRRICFVQIADQLVPDLSALFSGELKMDNEPAAELLCPVSGERLRVDARELALLAELPAGDWTDVETLLEGGGIDPDTLRGLIERQVILCDSGDHAPSQAILEAEERFEKIGWFDMTAVYHAMTRWTGVADDVATREHTPEAHRERLDNNSEKYGPPPTHFPRREDAIATTALDVPAFDSPLAQILRERQTTRSYDTAAHLSPDELSYMLYGCFGAQGIRHLALNASAVKRTSPSGGGLTPIDPYPLLMRVDGFEPGIYHYDMGSHALELIRAVPEDELRQALTDMTAGQNYFAQAHAAVIHVARFDRHHWKYRWHKKAYKAVLMDSAHLSQTFYLLATERGLGAYYTAAINDADMGGFLGLDPLTAAPIGVNGVGIKGDQDSTDLHFNPDPYTPEPYPS